MLLLVLAGAGAAPVEVTSLGTVSLDAVRLTGAGAVAGVRLALMFEATKTEPPPAPTAEALGARKGTYRFASASRGLVDSEQHGEDAH